MGNLGLCMVGGAIPKPKKEKMVQVMKMNDGNLLKFKMSLKVKDLLINYPNYYVGLFKEATQPLPLEYKLKIGQIYYLFPSFCFINNARDASLKIPKAKDGGIRIKVVVTRKQLQELLSSRVQVETMIMDVGDKQCKNLANLSRRCSRKLDCIPE